MRVFLAIDLPEHVRDELIVLQSSLTVGRPVPEENLHLTLCFLDEQPEEAVEEAHAALQGVRARAFTLRISGVGSFGSRSLQVVFADFAQCPELVELERRVTRSLRAVGLKFPKRRFRPHVTLARLPKSLSAIELDKVRDYLVSNAGYRGSAFEVAGFSLFQSTLMPRGARHEEIARYELAVI
ncbi:RNA 2',3'-cyclic phosphodiesterase [Ovoidimarina sediminis]|uniref:RNA 2',3'-cyclic phosphodiesterase n=1 Tax=Ovoidimarina sediminis TaxID=3079856 RepID=UPI00290A40D3|nr:RNA 2',3'-cyclic phosphodiesterase [Rhodophyticola sp. MJ-SS7]MDU8945976.1 RNA 2',3'-cyclic phosphodiesterase [Rhodophyticola sp. MJ-SS7]